MTSSYENKKCRIEFRGKTTLRIYGQLDVKGRFTGGRAASFKRSACKMRVFKDEPLDL